MSCAAIIIGAWAFSLVDCYPAWEPVPLGELPAVCAERGCIPAEWPRDEVVRRFVGCNQ